MRVEGRESKVECRAPGATSPRLSTLDSRPSSAFTIVELLVVISIIGILAALTVPALKDLGKANINASASQQMIDDVGRARQLAISSRTTVYMVFIPTNYWLWPSTPPWLGALSQPQRVMATNLAEKQLCGYTFLTLRTVGDQPGNPTKHYFAPWKALPDGTYIDAQKFANSYQLTDPGANVVYPISQFNYLTNSFPTETSPTNRLAYIAFNYLGQLTVDGKTLAPNDEYIPLARGSVLYGHTPDKLPQLTTVAPADITLSPPANSTNIAYNVIHIDAFTGRATLEYHRMP